MAGLKDVSVIIFDVGRNTMERAKKNGPTFFEREKDCVQKILMRKLFSRPKDECMLLLMGTEDTDNELNTELSDYEHITNGFPMAVVTWNVLKYVEYSIDPVQSEVVADWLDAIIVAMHYLKPLQSPKTKLKIFLLTTFNTETDRDQVDVVIQGLKTLDIELIVITSSISYQTDEIDSSQRAVFSQTVEKDSARKRGEKLIMEIIEETNGALCSFDEAIQQLIYFEKKQKRRVPWNCDLEIGNFLQIKTAAYIYVREEKQISAMKHRGPNAQRCKTVTEYLHNDEKVEATELVENVLKGYMYGQQPVVSEGIEYNSGGRSFKCVGFTSQTNVHDEYLTGTGIWAVVAQKNCPVAEKMLAALAKVMREMNLAMIARYVYGGNAKPKMMALFPNNLLKGKPNHHSLVMHELIFIDNYVQMQLPSLKTKKTQATDEELEAVDKLIDSMDLMSVPLEDGDDDVSAAAVTGEAFRNLLNPVLQHTYRTTAYRALHPKERLQAVDPDLIALLNAPPSVKSKAKPHAEKIKELFKLEPNVRNTTSRKYEFYNKIKGISSVPETSVVGADGNARDDDRIVAEIGTITPDEDFISLLERGESLATVGVQMQNVIYRIVFQSMVIPEDKIKRAFVTYREMAKSLGPFRYNEWIVEFKKLLMDNRKLEFWQTFIVKECFGLITKDESDMSTTTGAEASAFYKDDIPTTEANAEPQGDDDDDNMFDAM